ncbi:MAG: 3-oxoacyl-(acyl-carrier-protein) synthase 2 [Cryptosporangiaceae bacterium]|jgi:3-oxoacyl-[acyl-carrier-protein] synthase II|nr:3-oxoacyl-(acyl-carrier-protein) synthase 2 [Cryptosporangiaceae bacterium]
MGAVSPLGVGVQPTWEALVAGKSGIGPVTGIDVSDLPVRIAAQASDFNAPELLGAKPARQLDRFAQMALHAAREARAQAGLEGAPDRPDRWATVVSTGIGGVSTEERAVAATSGEGRVSPFTIPAYIANAAVAAVAQDAGARGQALAPVTACAAGSDAVGIGADMIRLGRADVVLVGGAEAPVTRSMLAGFAAMKAASTRNDEPEAASRPFDANRGGLVVGEGAAILVLESAEHAAARGAEVLAEVAGYAATNDAYNITAPRPDGLAASAALRNALADAGVEPSAVDYVNAHGTGTKLNDEVEARVLSSVLGEVPTSSTKSMTGHLMGAAGALEAVIAIQALRTGLLPPTVNLDEIDQAAAGLDHVRGSARRSDPRVAVSTSFGFGGHNAVLVFRKV